MDYLSPNEKLLWALMDNDEEETKKALDAGADANLSSPNGSSPLHAAALTGSASLIKELVEHKAKVNQANTEGFTPLMVAARNGRTDAVNALLDNGANANLTRCGNTGETALHMAMEGDSPEVVRALVAKGAGINATTTEDEFTPLHYAAALNSLKMAEVLLEYYTCSSRDKKGRIPAEVARDAGHYSLAEYLDMCTAAKTEGDKKLVSAIFNLDEEAAWRALKNHGADANVSSSTGSRPLHAAALRNSASLIHMLKEYEAKVDQATNEGFTPLMVAALNGKVDAVTALLEKGANPNKERLDTGETALHMAMNGGSPGVVRALVFGGADVNAQTTEDKFAPQHFGAKFGALSLTKELEKSPHYNANLLDANSRTAQLILQKNDEQETSSEKWEMWQHDKNIKIQGEPPSEDEYKVNTSPRGKVLILNSVPRHHKVAEYRAGTKDAADLEALFKKMGYATTLRNTATKKETKQQLMKLRKDKALEEMDCVVVCLLGNGFSMDTFYTSDNQTMTANKVYAYFTDKACTRLKGKPKLFLFDSNQDETGSQPGGTDSTWFNCVTHKGTKQTREVEAVLRDRVSLYAEGVKAGKECKDGSFFVQSIVEIFREYAHTLDVEELATKVYISMKEKMEGVIINTNSTTTKKFYLNPVSDEG